MFRVRTSTLLRRYGQLACSASWWLTCAACTLELPEPLEVLTADPPPEGSGGNGGADAASSGGVDGGAVGGKGSGGTPNPGCGAGVAPEDCPPTCSSASACDLNHATSKCDETGACRIARCATRFVDCDGEVANGCEEDFRGTDKAAPLIAHQLLELEDLPASASGDRWAFHPVYSINAGCINCSRADNALPEKLPPNPGARPEPEDLLAVFQAGWNGGGLYLRLKIMDDDPYTVLASEAGATAQSSDPRWQDNIELVYFGLLNGLTPSPANDQLYVSFDGRTANRTEKTYDELLELKTEQTPGGCRFSELRLGPNFLSGENGADKGLTTMQDQLFTFNIGVNDFSPPAQGQPGQAPPSAIWQHQRFYKDPQDQYWFREKDKESNVGELRLEGPLGNAALME